MSAMQAIHALVEGTSAHEFRWRLGINQLKVALEVADFIGV